MQAKYHRKFNLNNYPQRNQLYRWAPKFRAAGSVNKSNKKSETPRFGRKLTVRSPGNVNVVRDSVARNPKKYLRRRSQALGVSRTSVQRIVIKHLHLYPYMIQVKHEFTTADMSKRFVIWRWFDNKIEEDPDFLDYVWFSDETHFLLCDQVNNNNNVFRGTRTPDQVLQSPSHSLKCRAWVVISKHEIIGSFWCYIMGLNEFWRALGSCRGASRDV